MIKIILLQLRNALIKQGINNPTRLELTAFYLRDILKGRATGADGSAKVSELPLKNNSTFTDTIKEQLKGKLKYDRIDTLIIDIDFINDTIKSDVYYILNNEKLFFTTTI